MTSPEPMNSARFWHIRKLLKLSTRELARALRLAKNGDKRVREMESGEFPISGPISLLMETFEALEISDSAEEFIYNHIENSKRAGA